MLCCTYSYKLITTAPEFSRLYITAVCQAHESDSQPVSSVGMETTNVNMADNHTLLVSWAIQSKQFSFPPADTSIPMTLLMLLSALNASHMLHISAAFELQHNLTK